jgi:hypothetical protein
MAAIPAQNGAVQGAMNATLQSRDIEGLDASGDYTPLVNAVNSFALQASSSVGAITTGDDQNLFAAICAGVLTNRNLTLVNNTPGVANPYYPWCQAAAEAYTVAVAKLSGGVVSHYGALIGAMTAILSDRDLTGLTAAGDYTAPVNAADSFALQVGSAVGVITAGNHEILLSNIVAGAMHGRSISVIGDALGSTNPYYALSLAIAEVYTASVGALTGSVAQIAAVQGGMQGMLASRDITGLTSSGDYATLIDAVIVFAEEVAALVVSESITVATSDDSQLLAAICAAVSFGRPYTSTTEATYTASATAALEAFVVAQAILTS